MKQILGLMAFLIAAPALYAADLEHNWHQWRGPLGNGTAPDAKPPVNFGENTNVLWKIDLPGEGLSTPIVWGDNMFVTYAEKTDKLKDGAETPPPQSGGGRRGMGGASPTNYYKFGVLCIDKNTGKEIWNKVAADVVPHAGHHPTGSFAAGSPYTDGERLYVTFGSQGIFCFDLDGNKIWDTDLGEMQIRNSFGEGVSVVAHGDSLIVNWDHEGDSLLHCLNAKTGDVKWKTPRNERSTWGTPLVTEYDGVTQVICTGQTVVSYNLADGKEIWRCSGQTSNPIPSPFRYKDNVIVMSGFRGAACYSIPLSSKGEVTAEKAAWTHNSDTPYVPSALLYDDQLYFLKGNNNLLTSIKANDGTPVIDTVRLPARGTYYSSPMGADGKIYIANREGDVTVLKHGDSLEVLAENKLNDGFTASPVALGDKLYLRGFENLYCFAQAN